MSVELALDTPLAQRLNDAIQPKLMEVGWSTGGADDSALAEYIILMLVNGKTQDQIAAELSGDLLNLGPDDPGAREFSQWLFEQVISLSQPETAQAVHTPRLFGQDVSTAGQDAEMDDTPEGHAPPTGPKSMRNGGDRSRDKRMFNHLGKAMDRTHDSVLHRVRPHGGNERINTHSRAPPTGPRGGAGMRGGRPAMGRGGMGQQAGGLAMNQQQQMELFAMLEQQSRMMAQMFTPQQQQAMMQNGGMPGVMNAMNMGQPQQQGRSLFDRVQPRGGRQNGFGKGPHSNGRPTPAQQPAVSAMDMELTPAHEPPNTDATCKYNLTCTNKDCKFAHQSPAAPPGTAIDITDNCSFGAACKNRKCTARHPSPAQKVAHQIEQDCKFFPNCTNPRCPFRHPDMPLCRNGADCTTSNCKFTHVKTMCKFNPCLNPTCAFKHEDGQKRGKFDDKVWVAGQENKSKEHVSERKFVDDSGEAEELIIPGATGAAQPSEMIT